MEWKNNWPWIFELWEIEGEINHRFHRLHRLRKGLAFGRVTLQVDCDILPLFFESAILRISCESGIHSTS